MFIKVERHFFDLTIESDRSVCLVMFLERAEIQECEFRQGQDAKNEGQSIYWKFILFKNL